MIKSLYWETVSQQTFSVRGHRVGSPILSKHLFLICFVFFFFLVLPRDRGVSGFGADLFALGTVEPIKLKLQTHEFEV